MSRTMTRKQFVRLGLHGAGAAMAIIVVGCPDDDDDVTVDGTETTVSPTTETTEATDTTVTPTTETTLEPTTDTTGEPTTDTGVDDTAADDTVADACAEVVSEVGPPSVGPEHDHVVEVPAAAVIAGRTTTYMLSMDLGHVHEITVSQEMFAQLAAGQPVMTETLVDATQHSHPVTLVCAG
jgi:hypothetical protein